MYRLRKIKFINHPILNDLELSFLDSNGKSVDTIILAGENGTGKSTVINEIYKVVTGQQPCSNITEYEVDGIISIVEMNRIDNNNYNITTYDIEGNQIQDTLPAFSGVFSDIDINFKSNDIHSVTSMSLDEYSRNKRSNSNLPTLINQLLVDIQALDDSDLAKKAKENPEMGYNSLEIEQRMDRFKDAFNIMFNDLRYDRIDNKYGKKIVYFKKNNTDIPIELLSSGEKQIVYRGSFLLKDVNALDGVFVFIDEPEISLHPEWQNKIMDYYKGIFTNDSGYQTSQMFVVTHSPFIIHNANRKNDKIIILTNNNGQIIESDKREYYKCSSKEIIREAFNINFIDSSRRIVYLEGRTDELYFNKALEIYNCDVGYEFKWIGHFGKAGQEENSGADALNKALQFLITRNPEEKTVLLYDCDTNKDSEKYNNVYVRTLRKYSNAKGLNAGIENALILDDNFNIRKFYSVIEKTGDYGEQIRKETFNKMDFCNYICSLDKDILKNVFRNLKTEIDELSEILK